MLRLFGIARSNRNPNICTRCNTHLESGSLQEVTVLFADLSGFTAMTRELGPDRTHRIVNAFLTRAAQQVVSEDGYVDKFIGDALMAVFNIPIGHADHAAAAFRAAMAIQALMPALSAAEGREIQASIGIAKGFARTGAVGGPHLSEHTLLGDVVNLAARLQSHAGAGSVLVDAEVYATLGDSVYAVPPEQMELKGFAEPVTAHRFGAASPRPTVSRPLRRRPQRLGFGAIAFALLGAPCAAAVALTPLAAALGVASAVGVGGISLLGWLDQSWIRLPALAIALVAAVANLAAVHRAARLRRERPTGGFLPPSSIDRFRTRLAVGLAVFTVVMVVLETAAHGYLHPRS